MIIAGEYSFNGGIEFVKKHFPTQLQEIIDAIHSIDATVHKTKVSKEKTMAGKMLYSPVSLNKGFKKFLLPKGWINKKAPCQYPTQYYTQDYIPVQRKVKTTKAKKIAEKSREFRDMDFLKEGVGVEVQFGKYSFMVYNVCAKMTIFKKLGHIKAGIEIVPIKQFAEEMSTGVSYFEQFVWDLEQRGVSDIDIPVYIIGIDAAPAPGTDERPKADVNDLFLDKSPEEVEALEQSMIESIIQSQDDEISDSKQFSLFG